MKAFIERTGKVYSMSSSEFHVHVNGMDLYLWSPPWNEMSDDQEEETALTIGFSIWYLVNHMAHKWDGETLRDSDGNVVGFMDAILAAAGSDRYRMFMEFMENENTKEN